MVQISPELNHARVFFLMARHVFIMAHGGQLQMGAEVALRSSGPGQNPTPEWIPCIVIGFAFKWGLRFRCCPH